MSVSDEIGPVTIYSQWENVSILDILLHFCLPHEQISAVCSNRLQLRHLQPVTPADLPSVGWAGSYWEMLVPITAWFIKCPSGDIAVFVSPFCSPSVDLTPGLFCSHKPSIDLASGFMVKECEERCYECECVWVCHLSISNILGLNLTIQTQF